MIPENEIPESKDISREKQHKQAIKRRQQKIDNVRKLYPYERDVIEMRAKGITYPKIHEYITKEGYRGSVASLRMFMQKERAHLKNVTQQKKDAVEYIPRKFMCQLIYKELENIKGLTKEQYEAAIKK